MDTAVALVQAYLTINRYFTVTEYPLVEHSKGQPRARTDLDILAFRLVARHSVDDRAALVGDTARSIDVALRAPSDRSDMIIGEVKEGTAQFNPATRDPLVIQAALQRFGCCDVRDAEETTRTLLRRGVTRTACGHQVRMLAFGAVPEGQPNLSHTISLVHVVTFLMRHIAANRDLFRTAPAKHPALAWLALLDKLGVEPKEMRHAMQR